MNKAIAIGFLVVVSFVALNVALAQNPYCIPGGSFDAELCYQGTTQPNQQVGAQTIFLILQNIGGFIIAASGVIAGIVIIVSGLIYMSAGSNQTRVTTAKAVFKNGVIGAIILFAAGIIINTIILLASNWATFFNT